MALSGIEHSESVDPIVERSTWDVAVDLVGLTKPNVTFMNLVVVLGAYALAGGEADPVHLTLLCLGTLGIVGSAGAANMVMERESDKLMARTAGRALPRGRLSALQAVVFSAALGVASLPLMLAVHWTVCVLGLAAWFGYVCVYTPMKRRHPSALIVGAVPGAVPPLMGWAAATGGIELGAVLLFGLLVAWQMAHFLGIALYRVDDYRRAGLKTVAVVRGVEAAKREAMAWAVAQLGISLLLVATGLVGWLYGVVALALGGWMLALAVEGLKEESKQPWARRFFLSSVIYLPVLIGAMALDAML